jgi:hypothetical protein
MHAKLNTVPTRGSAQGQNTHIPIPRHRIYPSNDNNHPQSLGSIVVQVLKGVTDTMLHTDLQQTGAVYRRIYNTCQWNHMYPAMCNSNHVRQEYSTVHLPTAHQDDKRCTDLLTSNCSHCRTRSRVSHYHRARKSLDHCNHCAQFQCMSLWVMMTAELTVHC